MLPLPRYGGEGRGEGAEDMLRSWKFGGEVWELGRFPKLMGILNITPDSFSDGGKWSVTDAAVEQGLKLAADGADIIDVGGESTRPGAVPVPLEEEMQRVVPVIEKLAKRIDVPISIDTMKADVARAALAAGARIVNDVTALTFDEQMVEVCTDSDCGVILMHLLGTPQTMQHDPRYDDVVREVAGYLQQRLGFAVSHGIAAERIVFDPGIGFGKTAQHNLDILKNVAAFRADGRPVLIGHSRKGFLSKVLGRSVEERLAGTIGVSIAVAAQHADIIRVHDIAAVRDALVAWKAVEG